MPSNSIEYLEIILGLLLSMSALTTALVVAWFTFSFNRRLEKEKTEQRRREQATLMAEVLAEWDNEEFDRTKTNKLVWEATLWFPDDLALLLNNLLSKNDKAPRNSKELLVKAKTWLWNKETSLKANDIVYFPKSKKEDQVDVSKA